MIGKAFNRHVPPVYADDAFDDPDVQLFRFENAALLDVQLDISRNTSLRALNCRSFCGISAEELDPFANGLAAATDQVELFLTQFAIHCATSNQTAFFVLKDDDFERMSRHDIVFGQRLCDFDGAQRSNIAVIISAFRDAVDVRAKKNWSKAVVIIRSGATADDVSCRIDLNIKLRRAHQTHHVLAALSIGLAVRNATNT